MEITTTKSTFTDLKSVWEGLWLYLMFAIAIL